MHKLNWILKIVDLNLIKWHYKTAMQQPYSKYQGHFTEVSIEMFLVMNNNKKKKKKQNAHDVEQL